MHAVSLVVVESGANAKVDGLLDFPVVAGFPRRGRRFLRLGLLDFRLVIFIQMIFFSGPVFGILEVPEAEPGGVSFVQSTGG